MPTLDSGRSRSKTDILKMAGHLDPQQLGAAVSLVKSYRDGNITSRPLVRTLSNAEVLELVEGPLRGVEDSIAWAERTTHHQVKLLYRKLFDPQR